MSHDKPKEPGTTNKPDFELVQKLNLETGQLDWPELQTFFARGIVIVVDREHDLIEIAKLLHADNKSSIESMIENGGLVRANDDHARDWLAREPVFWSVVIAPWVLVQEKPS